MSRRRLSPLILAAVMTIATATAVADTEPVSPVEAILRAAGSPADLRARLAAFARATESADRASAGEAWYYVGSSYSRGAALDSAVAAWRSARDLRNGFLDRYVLADALLRRRRVGDLDEALAVLRAAAGEAAGEGGVMATRFERLLGWGHLLAGDTDSALAAFEGAERDPALAPLWRYRYARVLLESGQPARAIEMLRPLGVASRTEDEEVMRVLETAAHRIGQGEVLDGDLAARIKLRDDIEARFLDRIGGRRIRFAAADKFPLSGVLLTPATPGRHRAAIVLVAPEDSLAEYDSLAVALRDGGYSTLLMNVRGSGWSVAPVCPRPESWDGREDAMLRLTARDVREAVRAVCLVNRTDTSAVVVVGSKSMALAGALAAAQDRRVKALVLLSPDPEPVDRGVLLAALARRRLPLFLQQTPEDFPEFDMNDLAYRASAQAASRVSDGRAPGRGAAAFHYDRRVTPRFIQWLNETLLAPATPRVPPRKG